MSQRMSVALIGPATASGAAVLSALEPLAHAVDVVGLAPEGDAGGTFEWRGEQPIGTLDGFDFDAVEAIISATAFEPPTDAPPCLLLTGDAPVLGASLAPIQRAPDPVARAIARVVKGLQADLTDLDVTILDAASVRGRAGMDELRDQTIALLNFRPLPTAVFEQRLAFDLLLETSESEAAFSADLAALCPLAPPCAVRRVVIPTFIGAAVDLRLRGAVDGDRLTAALEAGSVALDGASLAALDESAGLSAARIESTPTGARCWLLLDDLRWGIGATALDFLARIRAGTV